MHLTDTIRPAAAANPLSASSTVRLAPVALLLAYAVALIASINNDSLWADEAFSAWVACHRSFGDLLHTLWTGDSSDLQMLAYYSYLHAAVTLLGSSEWALRIANAPFALLFAGALYWTSKTLFLKPFAWIAAGLLPFAWVYAREARPYCILLACSTASLSALLIYLFPQSGARAKGLPFACLAFLWIGALFHMLALLIAPPLALILALATTRNRLPELFRDWKPALLWFSVPFLALGVYLAYTFARGTSYLYPPPTLARGVFTLYELTGLFGLGPDHLELWSRTLREALIPYAPYLAAGTVLIMAAIALAFLSRDRGEPGRTLRRVLGAAAALAIFEAVALSIVTGHQISSRHCAALIPIFLFLFLATLGSWRPALSGLAVAALFIAWGLADLRLSLLPQYQKEDYRGTVAAVIVAAHRAGADIAWQPDPLAARYYGLDFPTTASDCFPLPQACAAGFSHVAWPTRAAADAVDLWDAPRIHAWMNAHVTSGKPALIVLRGSRQYESAAWRADLAGRAGLTKFNRHGFEVFFFHPPASATG